MHANCSAGDGIRTRTKPENHGVIACAVMVDSYFRALLALFLGGTDRVSGGYRVFGLPRFTKS